jgi:hypothetical protein
LVQTTNKPQIADLGLFSGADDGNRTRALSLGITGAFSASTQVSGAYSPEVPSGAARLVTVADRAVPLRMVRKWCGCQASPVVQDGGPGDGDDGEQAVEALVVVGMGGEQR